MTTFIDRAGIFKAYAHSWYVKSMDSGAAAICVEFIITAQLDGSEWVDWTHYSEIRVRGDYWVVTKEGTPNVKKAQMLGQMLGWNGSFKQVQAGPPSSHLLQVKVEREDYKGKTMFKASWLNPEDYEPTGGGADDKTVDGLEARFGSLLRAAAGSAQPPAKAKPKAATTKPAAAPPPKDDIPF